MLDDVTQRLQSLGYTVTEADSWMITFIISKVTDQIKGQCNTLIIPEGLMNKAVDVVCGEFLLAKKSTGQLTGFDFDAAVKSIQEGDVNVTYAFGSGSRTPEERFDELIGFLMMVPDYASHRKLRW